MMAGHQPRILITGGSGYIGAPTTRALVSSGCEVHVMGRTDPAIDGATFHRVDLLRAPDLSAAVEQTGAQTLLHLAWSVTPGRFWTDPANDDWAEASLTLFRAFGEAGGRRIVGIGSCAEYDWSNSFLTEGLSPIRPGTPYGNAKARVWSRLEAMALEMQISVAWARLFFLYGPGEPRGKLVADAVNSLLDGKMFETTSGLQRRDFIHVEDAAAGLAALAISPVTGPVNIGSGEGVAVRDLLDRVAAATRVDGFIDFGARRLADGEPMELVADTDRLRKEVGFTPRFTLVGGIAQTVAWWQEHRSSAGEFTGDRP